MGQKIVASLMGDGQPFFVHPKTEELLYLLLWSADQLIHPTFRNLTDSFETWAYRNGLLRQLQELERRYLVERPPDTDDPRVIRLTEVGRVHSLGGRDPERAWTRSWDGQWRMVLYDVPVGKDSHRRGLRRYLHSRHFGYLQNSVWITPDPLREELPILAGTAADVESLLLLDARPAAGESDAEIVAGAWDFGRINQGYRQHLKVLAARPGGTMRGAPAARAFRAWADTERAAWRGAVARDPLLPERLLPKDYLGRTAWEARVQTLAEARKQLLSFRA